MQSVRKPAVRKGATMICMASAKATLAFNGCAVLFGMS
jgi:hypothetical protein